jgi:calcium-binding protein CML
MLPIQPDKGGLDFDGLKEALNALGAQMEEVDMREIFYESDMVRDNSLSQNEFIISLAIAHLLGLITNFDSITQSLLVHTPEDVTPALLADSKDDLSGLASPRDTSSVSTVENASELVARVLDLMVTAYLLFDTDASGTIQVNEVLALMKKHHDTGGKRSLERKASGMSSRAIRNERIKELDFDQDGTITFQEFVLTFQRWVGADIDVDE